jgi:hypothetical protein
MRGLYLSKQEAMPMYHKGRKIDTKRLDFVVVACLAEINAKGQLGPEDCVKTLCYLHACG